MSTFLFFTPWSALEARHTELVANGRLVDSLGILEVIRVDGCVEVVASARLPSDVVLELAPKRCRHASHIRLGVTLAPRIMVNTAVWNDVIRSLVDTARHCSLSNP
jgi:hypothetical protein